LQSYAIDLNFTESVRADSTQKGQTGGQYNKKTRSARFCQSSYGTH